MNLVVNELFGPTFQGEGRSIGMPVMFLRLAGCNLHCSWCDTKYAWDWGQYDASTEMQSILVQNVVERLLASNCPRLVISGGEPMLQQKALMELTSLLHAAGWWTEIETAGTMLPLSTDLVKQFNVSPKLESSGNSYAARFHLEVLSTLNDTRRAIFKFVVSQPKELDEVDAIVRPLSLSPVYIMPEGVTTEVILAKLGALAEEVVKRGYYLAPRLHTLLYGGRRGV